MGTITERERDSLESMFWAEIILDSSTDKICPYRGNSFISAEQYVLFCDCPKSLKQISEYGVALTPPCSSHTCPVRTFLAGMIH